MGAGNRGCLLSGPFRSGSLVALSCASVLSGMVGPLQAPPCLTQLLLVAVRGAGPPGGGAEGWW